MSGFDSLIGRSVAFKPRKMFLYLIIGLAFLVLVWLLSYGYGSLVHYVFDLKGKGGVAEVSAMGFLYIIVTLCVLGIAIVLGAVFVNETPEDEQEDPI